MDLGSMSMNMDNRKTILLVSILTISIALSMFYSFLAGRNIAERYAPLIDASMEIKLEVTTAHLWLEEVLTDDRSIEIDKVWGHIDQAEWYAHAMLDGGDNGEGHFLPLKDPKLRIKIEQTLSEIKKIRDIAHERWESKENAGVGSNIDQRFDQVFLGFLASADEVETTLQKAMAVGLQKFSFHQSLLIVIIVFLGWLIGFVLYRHEVQRISNMQIVHDREENLSITLNAIGDAVIVTDVRGDVTYLNPVAEDLTGWLSAEAEGVPLTEVFNIVHAHTLKPAENPVEKVLKTGKIVGLANHTMLIAKNGDEYQIADSGSPIRSVDGAITGVVLVFSDVTEEYTLHESLKSNELFISTLLHSIPDLVWLKDRKGVYQVCNERFQRFFGAKESEIIGKTDFDFVDAELAEFFREKDNVSMAAGKACVNEEEITFADDGHTETVETTKSPIFDSKGNLLGILGIAHDITARKEHEFQGNIRRQVLELLVKAEPLITILESIVHVIEGANPEAMASVLLLDKDKKHLREGAAPNLPDFYNEAVDGIEIGEHIGSCGAAAYTKQCVIVEDIQTHPNWAPFKALAEKANLAACWSVPIIGSGNAVLGTFAIYHHEISQPTQQDLDLINLAAQLSAIAIEKRKADEQESLSTRVFSCTHEGILITDSNGMIDEVNPAFCQITGYDREDVIGKSPKMLSSGKQSDEFYADMWHEINENGNWKGEVWNRKKNGEIYAELLNISVLLDDDQQVINYIGVFTDITNSKKQQEQLHLIAHYDVLTGLPNRALFVDRFQQAIAHSNRTNTQLATCFLDLDDFKPVNDNYGHEIGDKLLVEVAERILMSIREEDTVSRQGGDEFALLLGDLESYSQCVQTLERIHHALSQPFMIDNIPHKVTVSSGVTLYPSDEGDIDTLLRHADQAMYQAKQAGRNRYHLFNTEQDQEAVYKHHRLEEIEQALVENEFQLYYQPKVNMVTGTVYGVEALIRWIHPKKGLIPPLEFLPILEGTELECRVGDWVINQALKQLGQWHELGIRPEVSVNISSQHLLSDGFVSGLEKALFNHPAIDSKCLQLEILESSALGDLNMISTIITLCQSTLGVNVALDDFGTGYSSLTHLRSLSANTIKIDQSFVRDLLDDPNDYVIVDGVIALAGSFNREVIAEGVESTDHGLMLILMGCDFAQGYGIAKPMPADDFPIWLSSYIPNQTWLDFSHTHRTKKENEVMLFHLVTKQWKNRVVTNIQAQEEAPQQWPIMHEKHDHCSYWFKRILKEQLFVEDDLNDLYRAHGDVHAFAQELKHKYQNGDVEAAREGLDNFISTFDQMLAKIETM